MPGSGPKPATVFSQKGFRVRRWWAPGPSPQHQALSRGARLRAALEELGGLYVAFGQFLSWRADLLALDYISALAGLRAPGPVQDRSDFTSVLVQELGVKGERICSALDDEPCWNTPWRVAYRTSYEGRALVVQVAARPIPERAWSEFENGIRQLRDPAVRQLTSPAVLAEFREWAHLARDVARERDYLAALGNQPGGTLIEYPRPIAELSGGRVLCWEWVDGEPLSALVRRNSIAAVGKLAEGLLEQFCILAVVNAEMDADAYVIKGDGKIALRRAHRMLAIPPPLARLVLRYITAVLANDDAMAADLLLRIAGRGIPLADSKALFDALAALQPELKVKLRFPASGKRFEAYWRAISDLTSRLPSFFNQMNRNLAAVSYWNAQAVAGRADAPDCLADAQWPVLGRLLNARLRGLLTRETATEWAVGSGLLFFESMRQAARVADGVRDKELSLGFDFVVTGGAGGGETARITRSLIIAAMLTVVFVLSLLAGARSAGAVSWALFAVAVLSGCALFATLVRLDSADDGN